MVTRVGLAALPWRDPCWPGAQHETMALVIWRLPHPVQGMVVFLVIFVAGSMLGGFGMGIPELAILALLAGAVAFVVATRSTGDDRSPS
jgi:hypothetical protein